jgi:predicted MFS family arabinose efflux permease
LSSSAELRGTVAGLADIAPPSRGLVGVFAFACALIVANLYYAQPLTAVIGRALGIDAALVGLVVTLTQLGYGSGLILLVSLADIAENRRLVLGALAGLTVALSAAALSTTPAMFLFAAYATGFCSAATQILVPFAAHLTPERQRGRTVGAVMSGLLVGIMLARPASSLLAARFGWHAIFWLSAAATICLAVFLRFVLPERRPDHNGLGFRGVLRSLADLLLSEPLLRRRAFYQGMAFSGFSLFWTAIPLVLGGPRFALGQSGMALFALVGAGGALAAPIAGRLADLGLVRVGTSWALSAIALCFILTIAAVQLQSVVLLALVAVLLDAGVQTNQVLSLRVIYSLRPEARGRLNALFMTMVFAFGGAASILATVLLHHGGWPAVALVGAACAGLALVMHLRS